MTTPAVHWYEGMFLRPQNFMAAERHFRDLIWQGDSWAQHYSWGLRSIEIDQSALSDYVLKIGRLRVRFPDGTQYCIPEDGPPLQVNLREALQTSPEVTAVLGCPLLSPWRANVAEPGSGEAVRFSREVLSVADESVADRATGLPARFFRERLSVDDENAGGRPRDIDVRALNVRVLLTDGETDGYATIPLARFRKAPRADVLPQLDTSYIPPVVACDAWPKLQEGILQSTHRRIGGKLGVLTSQAEMRGVSFDSRYQGDALVLAQIHELNEAYAVLGVIAYIAGVHPLTAYLELCRVTARLAVFGPARRVPDLPRYSHDDLGGCFYAVQKQIDGLLDVVTEPAYDERSFVGAGMRMEVALAREWVEPGRRLFIAVRSSLPADECVALLTQPGRLDMKVGSADQVDSIYRQGKAGLHIRHDPYPPRVLPAPPDLVFFHLDRDRHPDEWSAVQRSLTLAVRLNERLIAGAIQGKEELVIRSGEHTSTMQFILYAVPTSDASP
jgi:type VI secretion system protein ImpJ